ncbi:MAG: hypothetical protein K9J17_11945 [Flavobacteriales bacterium]|nr:hypothetical protein [Flavobacteriales bacterium]
MKHYSLILIALAAFSLTSCTKDFEDAKYRCKMNGEDFVPEDGLIDFSYTEQSGDDRVRIRGTRLATSKLSGDPYGELEIKFSVDTANIGTVELGYDAVYYGNNEWDKAFRSTAAHPGTVTVTSLDLINKRITCNFEVTIYADDSSSLTLTEGFFDQSW